MMKMNKRDVIGLSFMQVPYLIAAYFIVIMPEMVPMIYLEPHPLWRT